MKWKKQHSPTWDTHKARIIREGAFSLDSIPHGQKLSQNQHWWECRLNDKPVAYAWMEITVDDYELFIAVDDQQSNKGLGNGGIHTLEAAAKAMGANKVIAIVSPNNTNAKMVRNWFKSLGYTPEAPHAEAKDWLFEGYAKNGISAVFEKNL